MSDQENNVKGATRRRGSDILVREELTAYQVLRRYQVYGSWFGNLVFFTVGIPFAFYLGGYGGAKFFEVLFLMDLTGSVASIVGAVIGVFIGFFSIWAILTVVFSALGALAYWLKYRSFPTPG